MKDDLPRIVIGICTRQRNALLRRLLDSIWQQPPTDKYVIQVVVVDNNDLPSITPDIIDTPNKFQLTVIHEPNPGLVYARNRVLEFASTVQADWLIGIDDDEWVAPDWLDQFIKAFESLNTPIIVAAKQIHYSPDTSPYIAHHQHPQIPAGARSQIFSTANFAIQRRVFNPHDGAGLRFDIALNESGGEDYEFMLRSWIIHGFRAQRWPHAIAHEAFYGRRATFKYHFHRRLNDQVIRYRVTALHLRRGLRKKPLRIAYRRFLLTNHNAVFGTADCIKGLVLLMVGHPQACVTIGDGLFKWARAIAILPYHFGHMPVLYGAKVNADRSNRPQSTMTDLDE